jgi:hypothetical protein
VYGANTLAADSGGFSITDIINLDIQLDKLNQRLSRYYILGYQSGNQKHDGEYRKLRITTNARGVTLRYKSGYQDRRPIDIVASSRQEQALLTALATPGSVSQLPLTFRPAYFLGSSGPALVLLAASIQTEKLAFKRRGGQMTSDLNFMGAAYAENGSIAARFSEALAVSFDKEKNPEFRAGAVPYRNYFRLRPGRYRLKLAVSDESGRLGSMEQSFEVPARPARGLVPSSLVIAEQVSNLPELIQKLRSQLQDIADPLLYSGQQIHTSVNNRLPAHVPVSVLFRLYNLPGPPSQLDLLAKAKLLDENGKEFALAPIPLKNNMSAIGAAEAAIYLTLPFQQAPPGKYKLVIEVVEPVSSQSATLSTDIELAN